jgi:hypothetical protein
VFVDYKREANDISAVIAIDTLMASTGKPVTRQHKPRVRFV